MSVASSSIRFIKFSTSSSSACACSSHSPSSSSTFRFSAKKATFVTIIRSSQTEGPLRRPVAPSPPTTLKPAPPSPPSPPAAPPKPVAVVVDKSVITMEFQRQKAKELQEYFKQKKLDEADQGPFFGFIAKNEISNGRWAMFGFAVGMLTEYATGSDFVDQIGQGTYSNVYKARDKETGKIVALKKVKFDTTEPESVKFMAREIMILQKLDHPNIVKLEGLATSRMQYSLYLVFEYMHSDLARIISRPDENLTEPQVKSYMHQLLSGLEHCHNRGILHRDIKGSNLLIDKNGMLKIADFGLANYFDPNRKRHLTSRVVTLWYRAPELLLGVTAYGVGIDLWSAGCLMAEMFGGRPIMPGRTEVEQLHRIFKLCGTPSEEYWKRLKVSTTFRPPREYKPSLREVFRDFPPSSSGLLNILLSLDPALRGSAASALGNEFFYTSPLACDLSGLPVVYKEEDEPIQARRHKNLKMRHRSKTQRERLKKDLVAMEKPEGDFGSSKEDPKKREELNLQQGSSTGTSTSSSMKQSNQEGSPPPPPHLLSPYVLSSQQQKMFNRSDAHPNATKNIKNLPPLPNAKTRPIKYNFDNNDDDNMYRLNQVQRSTSTREFRKLDQRKLFKLHAVVD